jgi:hypothetical protein
MKDSSRSQKLEDIADTKAARRALAAIKSGKSTPILWEKAKAELRALRPRRTTKR